MLRKSIDITVPVTISYVLLCSLILCSAKTDIPEVQESFSRFHRSEDAGVATLHGAEHQNVVSVKPPTHDNNNNKDVKIKNGTSSANVSHVNDVTIPDDKGGVTTVGRPQRNLNSGALLRGFSVFVGLSAIVVIYIVIRAISVRRKKTTVRKYGILTNREDVEMTPLGAEDDEEDTTLFDVSNQTRP